MDQNQSAHEVLARKWRPKLFSELIGQDAVVKTLSNAVKKNRLANAYLFTGPRGIGKTSIARILAKALNCLDRQESEPCNVCNNCQAISDGSHLDVLEIDGASNRGIDQIRELRDNVQFAPASSKYKIYIIDEVHMLTQEAFNALLKTLEEPPKHVKFMFATTEAHRMPNTILSRCQRFDLHKISPQNMISHLDKIAKAEKMQVDEKVLELITKVSDGALRDAESILDQLSVFADENITLENAYQMLGAVGEDYFYKLVQTILKGDYVKCLELVDQVDQKGKDFSLLILEWMSFLRTMLLVRSLGKVGNKYCLSEDEYHNLGKLNKSISEERLLDWIELISEASEKLRFAPQKRVLFEATLLRSIRLIKLTSIDDIIASINGDKSEPLVSEVEPSVESVQEDDLTKDISSCWRQVLEVIGEKKPLCRAYLKDTKLIKSDDNNWEICFNKGRSFHIDALSQVENKKLIEESLKIVFKKEIKIYLKESFEEQKTTVYGEQKQDKIKSWDERIQNHSFVQKALDVFQGRIEEVN